MERIRSLKPESEATLASSFRRDLGGWGGNALERSLEGQRKGNGRLEHQGLVRERLPTLKGELPGQASARKKRRRGR